MSARFWVASFLAGGCFTSAPPPPPISNASAPAPRAARGPTFETWVGTGYQPDANSAWAIEMRINRAARVHDVLGTIDYPTLGCSSELVRDLDRGKTIVAIEKLVVNPESSCVDGGTIVIRDDGETLEWRWYYENGIQGATAALHKQAPP